MQRDLTGKIREGKASYRKKMEEQLQKNNVSGVWKSLKTISGHKKPNNQAVGEQKWVNNLKIFFNRLVISPPPTQLSLLQPLSSALPVYHPATSPTFTPLSTTVISQPAPTGSPAINPTPQLIHSSTQTPSFKLSLTTAQLLGRVPQLWKTFYRC